MINITAAIVNLVLIAAAAWWLYKNNKILTEMFWPALALKIGCGVVLGLVYMSFYKDAADTIIFFNDGVVLAKAARNDFNEYLNFLWHSDSSFSVWESLYFHQPRSLLFVKIVSVVNLLTFDNYWITSVYFSFVSFWFAWRLVVVLATYFPMQKNAFVVAFLFLPSVAFWSSGILKESLVMASLYFITEIFVVIWHRGKVMWLQSIGLLVAVFILWQLKYYYAAIFIPVVVATWCVKFAIVPLFRIRTPVIEVVSWCLIFMVPLIFIVLLRPNFHPENFFRLVVTTSDGFAELSLGTSSIHYNNLQPTPWSMMINAPWALFSGLFRPFVWEADNVFQLLAAIENLFILMVTLTSFKSVRHLIASENRLLVLSIFVYAVALCIFLALSTPNFGTLSRYRIGFLPFFVVLISSQNQTLEFVIDFIQRAFSRLVR